LGGQATILLFSTGAVLAAVLLTQAFSVAYINFALVFPPSN
jgi:hypothetical protein